MFHTLACCQLAQMIEKGKYVEECKAEWFKRWKLEYPLYKSASKGSERA